ncbi:hypothetical protein NLI96_g188 [Meripilus lineatus]|uniref:Uncharacterized protein n=1 Tax=Meripilus lineatus TaxID=2056292 RepID=A0AAD5VF50_9APHY|nr:hypothetical protein NLI96_g188 [Physisporinus lineatus]
MASTNTDGVDQEIHLVHIGDGPPNIAVVMLPAEGPQRRVTITYASLMPCVCDEDDEAQDFHCPKHPRTAKKVEVRVQGKPVQPDSDGIVVVGGPQDKGSSRTGLQGVGVVAKPKNQKTPSAPNTFSSSAKASKKRKAPNLPDGRSTPPPPALRSGAALSKPGSPSRSLPARPLPVMKTPVRGRRNAPPLMSKGVAIPWNTPPGPRQREAGASSSIKYVENQGQFGGGVKGKSRARSDEEKVVPDSEPAEESVTEPESDDLPPGPIAEFLKTPMRS